MNVKRIEKVANGWVAYDEFGIAVAVATTDEQLAGILNITPQTPAHQTYSVYLDLNPDFNFSDFWLDVKGGRKIDAIKAFRHVFVSADHANVKVGLKASKDFIESIAQNTANQRNGWL